MEKHSHNLIESYKDDIDLLKQKNIIFLILCIIIVGNNPESELYVRMKQKECRRLVLNLLN